ncbi:Rtf2 RING-finger-domain-containing protein [Xylariaceae sp. FL0255]|nr:Rtf2 RING-finger-domain-containing protein [Xylariaceae sp. FL0255]
MGNDGGSIPKRRELVKEAAKAPTASELKASALESQSHLWSICPISSSPLDLHNTVSDYRGRLYNYEAVLKCLMPQSSEGDGNGDDASNGTDAAEFARTGIRSLKDVAKLRFSLSKRKENGKEKEVPTCPLSMKELGAPTRAVYIIPCGHVFAEVAMRELLAAEDGNGNGAKKTPSEEEQKEKLSRSCPECSDPFQDRDLLPILPTDDADIEKCATRIEELRSLGLTHNLKKDKSAGKDKKKKRKAEGAGDAAEVENGDVKEKVQKEKNKGDISSRINNSMTASLTAKVLAEQDEHRKRRKMAAAMV